MAADIGALERAAEARVGWKLSFADRPSVPGALENLEANDEADSSDEFVAMRGFDDCTCWRRL